MFKWTRLPEGVDPWETPGVLGLDYDKDDSIWAWVDTFQYPYPLEEGKIMKTTVKNTAEQIIFYALLIVLIMGSATACAWLFKAWMAANGVPF